MIIKYSLFVLGRVLLWLTPQSVPMLFQDQVSTWLIMQLPQSLGDHYEEYLYTNHMNVSILCKKKNSVKQKTNVWYAEYVVRQSTTDNILRYKISNRPSHGNLWVGIRIKLKSRSNKTFISVQYKQWSSSSYLN